MSTEKMVYIKVAYSYGLAVPFDMLERISQCAHIVELDYQDTVTDVKPVRMVQVIDQSDIHIALAEAALKKDSGT